MRSRAGQRRVPAIVWSLLGLLACLAFLGAAIAGTFRVRQVRVVGGNLPRDRIVQTAGVLGQNIFTVRSDRIVARLAQVRDIVVQRVDTTFPDTVTIYARPRTVLIAWQTGGNLYELDPDGRIVRQVKTTTLPVIVGTDTGGALGPGVVEAVRFAVETLPAAPDGAIATFQFKPTLGLTIVGKSGWTADVGTGSPQTLVNRIATLAAFLVKIHGQSRHFQFVDLRFRVPYARFTGT
jgi:hypothetical protein